MMVFAIGIFAFVITLIVGGILHQLGLPRRFTELVWAIAIIAVAGAISFSLPGRQAADGPWPYYFATVGGAVLAACLLTLITRRHPPVQ
jgi:hypothetical protein